MTAKLTVPAYKGSKRSLVLGVDIGTTYSGVSYALLEPGRAPEIKPVSRFPGNQGSPIGSFRIPTAICYRLDGSMYKCGAEADGLEQYCSGGPDEDSADEEDGDNPRYEDLVFYRLFKLSLFDGTHQINPPLLPSLSIIQLMADFIRYMFKCTEEYFTDSEPIIRKHWDELKTDIHFVFGHPNGGGGAHQEQMREAAIRGLDLKTLEEHSRIHFVTEGEASMLYCVHHGWVASLNENNTSTKGCNVMVVDAGGGTVDISSYHFSSGSELSAREISQPKHVAQGSTLVTRRLEELLKNRLQGPAYDDGNIIRQICRVFDTGAKLTFTEPPRKETRINVRLPEGNSSNLKLKNGAPALTREEMVSLFLPSLTEILRIARQQFKTARSPISTVLFVGGFACNEWLYENLKRDLSSAPFCFSVFRPEYPRHKEVSHGAVAYYVDRFVIHRIARHTLGTPVAVQFNMLNPEHIERLEPGLAGLSPQGIVLDHGFSTIVERNSYTREGEPFISDTFVRFATEENKSRLNCLEEEIFLYTGERNTRWMDTERDQFQRLCVVRAVIQDQEPERVNHGPRVMYKRVFRLVIDFSPAYQAYIQWDHDGRTTDGHRHIIPLEN